MEINNLIVTDNVHIGACSLVNSKQSVRSVSSLCGLCRGGPCQCRHQKTSSNGKQVPFLSLFSV